MHMCLDHDEQRVGTRSHLNYAFQAVVVRLMSRLDP